MTSIGVSSLDELEATELESEFLLDSIGGCVCRRGLYAHLKARKENKLLPWRPRRLARLRSTSNQTSRKYLFPSQRATRRIRAIVSERLLVERITKRTVILHVENVFQALRKRRVTRSSIVRGGGRQRRTKRRPPEFLCRLGALQGVTELCVR